MWQFGLKEKECEKMSINSPHWVTLTAHSALSFLSSFWKSQVAQFLIGNRSSIRVKRIETEIEKVPLLTLCNLLKIHEEEETE